MSEDLAEFRDQVNRGGRLSELVYALEGMDDEQRRKTETALSDTSITAGAIARVVRSWGWDRVTEHSVATYRRNNGLRQ